MSDQARAGTGTPGLRGAIWRWHFYAGLFVVPFMLLLAVTGGLYLFNHEIEERWYADRMRVQPQATEQASASTQEAAVLARWPGAVVKGLVLPRRDTLAVEWQIERADGVAITAFVDPWRAVVQGEVESEGRLMAVISSLHGRILAGWIGDRLIELAASWAFVLLVTGVYLWWPEGGGVYGTLLPRLRARGRVFWRDLHAVPAFWASLLVAFLILSGLPWSGFWGSQLSKLGTVSPQLQQTPHFSNGPAVPQSRIPDAADSGASAMPAEHHHHGDDKRLPWSVRHAAQPESRTGVARIGIDRVLAVAQQEGLLQPGLRIGYPETVRGVFTLGLVPARAQGQRTLYLDQYRAEPLRRIDWQDYSPLGKTVEWGVMTHMGQQYGLANQLIGLLVCVVIVLTAVSGTVMWWQRRPRGQLGAPSLPKSYRRTTGIVVITTLLGLLFPLMGASLVVVLTLDVLITRLVQSRTAPGPS